MLSMTMTETRSIRTTKMVVAWILPSISPLPLLSMPSSPSRSSGSPEASPPHHIYRDGVTKAVLRPPHSSASGSVQSTSSYSAPPLPLLPPLSIASSSGSRSDAGEKYVDAATGAPLARKPPTSLRLSNEQQHFSRVRSPLSPTSPLSPSSTSSFALSQTVRDPATGAPIHQHLHLYPQQPYSDQLPLSPPPAHKTTRCTFCRITITTRSTI
ncbi:hypothetical protein BD410DRAFT_636985 [Rickenella mellea]|uniref:Uncharacterized protein n=1 Tax=Rickenella mellea TaxID=50990 RepID=A0A4Y7QCD4_9AGAM|nr:hypothetical protein BD410DRAFT_636985 [Rickenella mellea]